MRTWLAVLLFAACSHGAPKPTTPVAASGATCDQVGAHVIQLMPAAHTDDNADLAKQLAGVLQDRCTKDGWSPEARQCIFDAKELKAADGCKQFLTQAQVEAVDKTMDERFPKKSEEAAVAPPPAAAPPPRPPDTKPPAKSRGAQKKSKPGGKAGKSGDPCEGGE